MLLHRDAARVEPVTDGVSTPQRYSRQFLAGWRTMDFNGHLANTAYLDLAADVRVSFFAGTGRELRSAQGCDR